MRVKRSWAQKVRFYGNLTGLYVLTIAFAWYAVHPTGLLNHSRTVALTRADQTPHTPAAPHFNEVSGRPVRLVIPGSSYNGVSIDLPVDPGYYDSSTGAWTLSGYRAQFAMMSTLANNFAGDTYIYGHNNDSVFGALRHNTPAAGATALLYTDNGHIFQYSFQNASSIAPDITSVLNYNGPPLLTIQTCTGSLNELRTLYKFSFVKVVH